MCRPTAACVERYNAPRLDSGLSIVTYGCAFCGEQNDVLVDPSAGRRQTFTEDCVVCCRPNLVILSIEWDGDVHLQVTQEFEA